MDATVASGSRLSLAWSIFSKFIAVPCLALVTWSTTSLVLWLPQPETEDEAIVILYCKKDNECGYAQDIWQLQILTRQMLMTS